MNEMPKFIKYGNQFIPVDMLKHIYYYTNVRDENNNYAKLENRLILVYRNFPDEPEEYVNRIVIFGSAADKLYEYLRARSVDVDEL
jgi:hypothetical protein